MSKIVEFNAELNSEYNSVNHDRLRKAVRSNLGTLQSRVHSLLMYSLHAVFLSEMAGNLETGPLVRDLTMLNEFGGLIRNKQSIHPWIEVFAGLKVEEDSKTGAVKVSKNKKWKGKRDEATFKEAASNPFWKIAAIEQPLKQPELSFKSAAAMVVRREKLGKVPNMEEMMEEFQKEIDAARTSKGMEKWMERMPEALEKGDIKRLDA